jgi:hypothetical protein
MNKQSWGMSWVLGMAAATMVLGPVACGDGFSSEDCKASRTCMGAAGTESSADGGAGGDEQTGNGGADNAAGSSNGGTTSCKDDADCSNDDPSDGEEVCDESVCAAGNPPPAVVMVTPQDQAVDVPLDSEIVIEFSEPLDPDSVTSKTIQILDGTTEVPGQLAYADGTVRFTPDAELALVGPYTITVSTDVTDVEGAPLLDEFTAQFSTRDGAWTTIDAVKDVLDDD